MSAELRLPLHADAPALAPRHMILLDRALDCYAPYFATVVAADPVQRQALPGSAIAIGVMGTFWLLAVAIG